MRKEADTHMGHRLAPIADRHSQERYGNGFKKIKFLFFRCAGLRGAEAGRPVELSSKSRFVGCGPGAQHVSSLSCGRCGKSG